MSIETNEQPPLADIPPYARRAWPIALIGAVGVLSLLLQPVPDGLLDRAPALVALPPVVQRGLLLVNPMVFLLGAALVGAGLAHRVGLGSILAGTAAATGWPKSTARAAGMGFSLGLVVAAIDFAVAPLLGQTWQHLAGQTAGGVSASAVGVMYGGVAEEVMMRWGVMSVVAWALVSLLGRRRQSLAMNVAIVAAAGLFAAAHLPALAALVELTPTIVARTLALNGAAGVLYGWLFWHRHLEAAIAAHSATHLGLAAWRVLMA